MSGPRSLTEQRFHGMMYHVKYMEGRPPEWQSQKTKKLKTLLECIFLYRNRIKAVSLCSKYKSEHYESSV